MSFRIPDEKIYEIRDAADIVEVISEVVRLKRTGKNFVGLCPFHSEKTPSFTVNPDKQIFHCFGCQEGGNVFSFLMKQENLTYPEAIRSLASRYGIVVPERSAAGGAGVGRSERELIFHCNRQAADYFHDTLFTGPRGKTAMTYLEKRNISPKMIRQFVVGYAPEGWDHLYRYLAGKNVSQNILEKAGLVIQKKEKNGVYDRFRNRLIFPITDVNGQIIGFGGRSLDDSLPKYLNSPDTPVYNKSRSLYGLYHAKKKCRESNTVYVVEGYMDCIALHQVGLENTVATLGTSLTPDHVRRLKGYAEKIILVFDSDDAGRKAAVRSVDLFIQQDAKARIMILPEGHDPDSYVQSKGRESFEALSAMALDLIGFLVSTALAKHGTTAEGKIAIINEMTAPLASITDDVARSVYIKEFSEQIDVLESAIALKVDGFLAQKGRSPQSRPSLSQKPGPSSMPLGMERPAGNRESDRSERRIISMMLQFPEILPKIERYRALDYFKNDLFKSIGVLILEQKDKSGHIISDVIASLDDDEKRRIVAELVVKEDVWEYKGCIKLILKFIDTARARDEKILTDQIKMAEKNNDHQLLLKLLGEKQKKAEMAEKQKMTLINGN